MARKMKDSGIEWIKSIPENWTCKRGKQLFIETNERSIAGTEELLTVSHITGVTPRRQKNVNMFMSESLTGYKICHPGDIAANTMWLWQGAVGVSNYHGVISPSYNTYRQRINDYDPKYLDYLLRIQPLIDTYAAYSTGITLSRLRLYPESFLSIYFIVPPLTEQQHISSYLDVHCSEIDAMLSKTHSSIEEYKKLKQAVITQAITKGVRGGREMKDSGVEWIGKIPKEWDVRKLKAVSARINVGVVIRPSEYFDDNGTVPFLRGINVKEYTISSENMVYISQTSNRALSKSQVHTGDILIVRDGNIGASCVVPSCYNGANVVSMVIVTPNNSCDSRFLCYSLNSEVGKTQFTLTKIGSALTHTSVSAVSDILSPVPSREEQYEIADYLDAKCAEIDGLIAKKEQLVKELEGYKKSLIYEVVTGKREV